MAVEEREGGRGVGMKKMNAFMLLFWVIKKVSNKEVSLGRGLFRPLR